MSETSVDAQQPWLGLDSFTESTRAWFHGRDEEIAELARRVLRKPLTVLFGQSGLGKTSILRAGLVPRLRPEGCCPVYLRVDYGPEAPPPAEQLKQAVFRATLASGSWSQTGVAVQGESLWEFLHHREDQLRDADGRVLRPLLIFDQFEEIFTLAQADDAGRARAAQFIEELADLVENRPPRALEARLDEDDTLTERFDFARCDYRVLIALREDYLAHLEALKGSMPSITQNRMRLARMTGVQALDAVLKPGGALVTPEVAEAIVRHVAGGAELRNAEVEPSLLSLICRELNAARIAQGRAEISADLLAGSHATILAEFYQRALADQPSGVHRFIEEALLTESGFRENIAQERVLKAFAEAGAAPDALARLVDRRLLRIEERLDVRRVELTHDVLCGVVGAARHLRHEREAREAAQAQLATQREREAATRAALVRARQVATVCGVLAVLAAGAAAFGIYGMRQAQATRAIAETARGESERLVVYLLDDFYRELEPVGRLEIVGELARRALDYYAGLPAELRGPETLRNQALAQVRHASVLRVQGRGDDARKLLAAAVPTLDGLRGQGDRSEATLVGLALGLVVQSRLGPSPEQRLSLAQRAVELLKPALAAAGASPALRRAAAAAYDQLGFVQQRSARNEEAVTSLRVALDHHRSLGLESDGNAAAYFAITSAWLMDAQSALERREEALRTADEARAAATQVLQRNPTHLVALRARALLASSSSGVDAAQLQRARQLAAADAAAEDYLLLARVDPSNVINLGNLLLARSRAASALVDLGRLREALQKVLADRAMVEALADRGSAVQANISGNLGLAAFIAAQIGQPALSGKLTVMALDQLEASLKPLPEGDVERAWPAVYRAEQALLVGDRTRVQEQARRGLEAARTAQVGDDPGRQLRKAWAVHRLHAASAEAAYELGQFESAESQARLAVEALRGRPLPAVFDAESYQRSVTLWAQALVRLGRIDEARPPATQALAALRKLYAQPGDDQAHKWALTRALSTAAWVDPEHAKALLDEAQKTFDSMPAELREAATGRRVEALIAEARRGRR